MLHQLAEGAIAVAVGDAAFFVCEQGCTAAQVVMVAVVAPVCALAADQAEAVDIGGAHAARLIGLQQQLAVLRMRIDDIPGGLLALSFFN
ncbi:hypothetical protein [Paenibacillus lemnae]|uniref:hypothetical protein n=1 Tax=Paenibacillus lemnae TaxID=1330551 RepID=UPI001FE9306B|nr:hypothetical protein [Paenibacillus lemnae]